MANARMTCCIKGCTPKTTRGKVERICFYSFPSDSLYTTWRHERRNQWIKAVKKYTRNPDTFEPTNSTKICSVHFVGNKKSDHPLHPAYTPTLFPGEKDVKKDEQSLVRFKRQQEQALRHTSQCQTAQTGLISDTIEEHPILVEVENQTMKFLVAVGPEKIVKSIDCQTDVSSDEDSCSETYLFCGLMEQNGICDALVQTNIIREENRRKMSTY